MTRPASAVSGDRRGTITLWIAMAVPLIIAVMSMAIEVTKWTVVQLDLQRAADTAAIGGAMNLKSVSNAALATQAAIRVAQLNISNMTGTNISNIVTSAFNTTTNATTSTFDANGYTYTITAAANMAANSIQVTSYTNVPQIVSQFISNRKTVPISTQATAAMGGSSSSSTTVGSVGAAQPCLFVMNATQPWSMILSTSGAGIQLGGCDIVVNSQALVNANTTVVANNLYVPGAGGLYNYGTVTANFAGPGTNYSGGVLTGNVATTTLNNNLGAKVVGNVFWSTAFNNNGTLVGNSTQASVSGVSQVTDPYAGGTYPALSTALTAVNAKSGGVSCATGFLGCSSGGTWYAGNTTLVLTPGTTYDHLTVAANATAVMPAGVYYMNGLINVGAGATLDGTAGVTILAPKPPTGTTYAGTLMSIASGGTVKLTAPTSAQATSLANGVAGVALASQTSSANNFISVGGTLNFTGLIYLPNTMLSAMANGAVIGGAASGGCNELIVDQLRLGTNTVTIGPSYFGSNCTTPTNYGLLSYSWTPVVASTTSVTSSAMKLTQ